MNFLICNCSQYFVFTNLLNRLTCEVGWVSWRRRASWGNSSWMRSSSPSSPAASRLHTNWGRREGFFKRFIQMYICEERNEVTRINITKPMLLYLVEVVSDENTVVRIHLRITNNFNHWDQKIKFVSLSTL